MLFLDAIGAEVRRLPGRFPWSLLLLGIVLLLLLAVGTSVPNVRISSFGDTTSQIAPEVPQQATQPVQQAPVVEVAPVIKEWLKVEVVWSEPFLIKSLADLPPALPRGPGIAVNGSSDEAFVFAQKIMPDLKKLTHGHDVLVSADVASNPVNPNIVFAGVDVQRITYPPPMHLDPSRLFLSVDGEKTWVEIHRPDLDRGNVYLTLAIGVEGDTVTLFVRDPEFVSEMWIRATLSLASLP